MLADRVAVLEAKVLEQDRKRQRFEEQTEAWGSETMSCLQGMACLKMSRCMLFAATMTHSHGPKDSSNNIDWTLTGLKISK